MWSLIVNLLQDCNLFSRLDFHAAFSIGLFVRRLVGVAGFLAIMLTLVLAKDGLQELQGYPCTIRMAHGSRRLSEKY